MAGKIDSYVYNADDGKQYTLRMDKSNATAVGNATGKGKDGAIPRGMQPRVVNCELLDTGTKRVMKRQLVVCKKDSALIKGTVLTINLPMYQETGQANAAFRVTGYTGEQRTFYNP